MKKLDNKAFILVETLIATIFVVSLFIIAYQTAIPYIGEYEKQENYDDIDSIYTANLFKQNLLAYGNFSYIDTYLQTKSYIDITDCEDINIYSENDFCNTLKISMDFSNDSYILLTEYDISKFRNTVNSNPGYFDSGKFSNFTDYIKQTPDVEKYYKDMDKSNISKKYRLFLIRNATNSDYSTTTKYTNIAVFK